MCLPVFLGNVIAVYSFFLGGWIGWEYWRIFLIYYGNDLIGNSGTYSCCIWECSGCEYWCIFFFLREWFVRSSDEYSCFVREWFSWQDWCMLLVIVFFGGKDIFDENIDVYFCCGCCRISFLGLVWGDGHAIHYRFVGQTISLVTLVWAFLVICFLCVPRMLVPWIHYFQLTANCIILMLCSLLMCHSCNSCGIL